MSKTKKKHTSHGLQIFLILVLLAATAAGVYYLFFADRELRDMGYTSHEISLLHRYQVADEVTEYNKGLAYALASDDFNPANIEYYVRVRSTTDATKDLNDLAEHYSVDQLVRYQGFLTNEELFSLVFEAPIENDDRFEEIYRYGYKLKDAIALANGLSSEAAGTLLTLPVLTAPDAYLDLTAKGYEPSFIAEAYQKLGDEGLKVLALSPYRDSLPVFVSQDGFQLSRLPRYLLALASGSSASAAVAEVNADEDIPSSIDYSGQYEGAAAATVEDGILMLVNKSHLLAQDYVPAGLKDLDAAYTGMNQPLTAEAADAFTALADAYGAESGETLVSYSGYCDYDTLNEQYNTRLDQLDGDQDAVDSVYQRAGANEHQTGLAADLAVGTASAYSLTDTEAYRWLLEHSWEYGWIQRYPAGQEWLTGIRAGYYHFRYVGTDAAALMHTYGWTLEEYNLLTH
jgi:LAS superfamily LD-carboxypeptidase LdcB